MDGQLVVWIKIIAHKGSGYFFVRKKSEKLKIRNFKGRVKVSESVWDRCLKCVVDKCRHGIYNEFTNVDKLRGGSA